MPQLKKRVQDRVDALMERVARCVPRWLQERIRGVIDPVRQREAVIAKLQKRIALCETQIEGFRKQLEHEHADLLSAKMRLCEAEEAAAASQKEKFETVLTQTEREEAANQASSVMSRELKTILANVGASLKLAVEETRLLDDSEAAVKSLESLQYQVGKASDLVENLRFYLKE